MYIKIWEYSLVFTFFLPYVLFHYWVRVCFVSSSCKLREPHNSLDFCYQKEVFYERSLYHTPFTQNKIDWIAI